MVNLSDLNEARLAFIDKYKEPWMGCMFVVKQNIEAVRSKLSELYYSIGCVKSGIDYDEFVDRLIPYYLVDPAVSDRLYLDTVTENAINDIEKSTVNLYFLDHP